MSLGLAFARVYLKRSRAAGLGLQNFSRCVLANSINFVRVSNTETSFFKEKRYMHQAIIRFVDFG